MERSLRIEHFRNIGFKNQPNKPTYERLVLNHSLHKGELGDLVILIGANNSGKSNILDALNIIANGNIAEHDITDLYMEDEYRNPKISLFCRRDEDKKDYLSCKKSLKNKIEFLLPSDNSETIKILKRYNLNHEISITPSFKGLNHILQKNFGTNFMSRIITYKQKSICNKDLISNHQDIQKNSFLLSTLKSINVNISTIHKSYEVFNKKNLIGILEQESDRINEKLVTISNKFNQLYYTKDANYSFKISLHADKIYFSLFKGKNSLLLDSQSVGFKWFFDLFFNLLCSNDIQAGDIIIMDEPATNLHIKGQRELRKFLKEFAVHNDVTIVMATHSPFLIDLDFLDELRVIKNDDNITYIENNFSAVNSADSDSLLAVKEALTIENHIIINPNQKLVFVEGITDYNYLTAFKHLLGKSEFTFLPINGVGDSNEESKRAVSKKLLSIRKDAILLVDGDTAGKVMKKINENSDLTVITLSDMGKEFVGKEIEHVFSDDDLTAFRLVDKDGNFNKYASTSAVFKNKIIYGKQKVSDETLNNFKRLFDTLERALN